MRGKRERTWHHAGLLVQRIVIAAIFLWHGVPKAFAPGGAMEKFEAFGLPGILGPVTGWVEVIAAPLLLIGFQHRPAAIVLLIVILGALATVQIPGGISAGLERDLLILAGLLYLAARGAGRFALRPTAE